MYFFETFIQHCFVDFSIGNWKYLRWRVYYRTYLAQLLTWSQSLGEHLIEIVDGPGRLSGRHLRRVRDAAFIRRVRFGFCHVPGWCSIAIARPEVETWVLSVIALFSLFICWVVGCLLWYFYAVTRVTIVRCDVTRTYVRATVRCTRARPLTPQLGWNVRKCEFDRIRITVV